MAMKYTNVFHSIGNPALDVHPRPYCYRQRNSVFDFSFQSPISTQEKSLYLTMNFCSPVRQIANLKQRRFVHGSNPTITVHINNYNYIALHIRLPVLFTKREHMEVSNSGCKQKQRYEIHFRLKNLNLDLDTGHRHRSRQRLFSYTYVEVNVTQAQFS
jgi:hypothetical protein